MIDQIKKQKAEEQKEKVRKRICPELQYQKNNANNRQDDQWKK